MKLGLFYLVLVVFPLQAIASDFSNVIGSFPGECKKTLELFIQENGGKVGTFDAKQALQDSSKIKWTPSQQVFAGSGDNRLTAEHLIEEKSVRYSISNLQINPSHSRFLVSFHECISASGIQDEQYQVTSSVLLNLLPKSYFDDPSKFPQGISETINKPLKSIELRYKNPIYTRSGGGTSVGGGGDGTAINFKIAALLFAHPLILKFPELFKHASSDIIDQVISLGFEIETSSLADKVTIEKKLDRYLIRIPMHRWLNAYKETQGRSISIDQWRMLLEALQLVDTTIESQYEAP